MENVMNYIYAIQSKLNELPEGGRICAVVLFLFLDLVIVVFAVEAFGGSRELEQYAMIAVLLAYMLSWGRLQRWISE
jgi:hypothetical protein